MRPARRGAGGDARGALRRGPAGTYHYWATTIGAPVPFRELAGAFIVDPPGADPGADRVLVITEWSSLTPAAARRDLAADDPGEAFVVAGRAWRSWSTAWAGRPPSGWPTGRVSRCAGGCVNLSSQLHPMHLHGFYFDVNSLGDGRRTRRWTPTRPRRVVTQLVPPGGTMTMAWTPERAGNWLFHCHVMDHVSPMRRSVDADVAASRPRPRQPRTRTTTARSACRAWCSA